MEKVTVTWSPNPEPSAWTRHHCVKLTLLTYPQVFRVILYEMGTRPATAALQVDVRLKQQ